MFITNSDQPRKSLQIKEDDKFFSRLLSKENSNSFRVYYGVASGSVPFMWESQPGTPKHPFSNTTLPPLTPPPSYYLNSQRKPITKKNSRSNLLDIIFPKLGLRKNCTISGTPSILSSSTSSFSSSSTRTLMNNNFNKRSRFSSTRSSFDSRLGDDIEDSSFGSSSPTSTLRLSVVRSRHEKSTTTGCYSLVIMKKALLSILGGGNGSCSKVSSTSSSSS